MILERCLDYWLFCILGLFIFVVLVRIAIIVIKCQDQKQLGEERVKSILHAHITFTNNGSQDKNLEEAGTDAEAMGDCFLQVCSS